MSGKPWCRLYADMPDNPKVGMLDDASFRAWTSFLCFATRAGESGRIGTLEEINWMARRDFSPQIEVLLQRDLIQEKCNVFYVKNWRYKQFKSDDSKERVNKHRAKKKQDKTMGDVTLHGRYKDRYCNAPETEQNRIEDSLRSSSPPAAPQRGAKKSSNLSRLPFDALPPDWDEWAHAAMGWDVAVTADVWAAFRDYWQAKTGKTAMKSDWFATWRNWCRSERPKGKNHEQRTGNRQPHDVFGSAWAGAAADLARPGRH